MKSMLIDLTGQRFGRLVVTEQNGVSKRGSVLWLCLCDCGQRPTVNSSHLTRGYTKSCGCLQKETIRKIGIANIKHGYRKRGRVNPNYDAWSHMNQRCMNPNDKEYKNYGGRGIKVCRRWKRFANFIEDMGERPTEKHSLDRIDNNSEYNKENCRWATKKEQAHNRRDNRLETYNGISKCVASWAEEYMIPYYSLLWRLNHEWSMYRALTTPIRGRKNL